MYLVPAWMEMGMDKGRASSSSGPLILSSAFIWERDCRVFGCRYSPRILSASALNSTFLMTDWNIQSRAHACRACEKPFVSKQPYHTLLAFDRHELARQDVCEACWTAQFSEGAKDRKGFISHWVGEYQAPPAAPPDAIQKENAESVLRKLMEKNDPQYRAAAYILAVMLERKKILKVKAQLRENGVRVFVYEQPKTGDVFTIPDPELQLNQLEAVQRQVAALMEHGIETAAETPAYIVPPDQPPIAALVGTSEEGAK